MLKLIGFASGVSQLSFLIMLLMEIEGQINQYHTIPYSAGPWFGTIYWNAVVLIPLMIALGVGAIPLKKLNEKFAVFQRCFVYGAVVSAPVWLLIINMMPSD